MKKNLLMVLGMVMLMMLSVASADSGNAATLPDGIKQILNGSAKPTDGGWSRCVRLV